MQTQIKSVERVSTTWLVTFWQGGQVEVQAPSELEALVLAARMIPWAEIKRVEAWD